MSELTACRDMPVDERVGTERRRGARGFGNSGLKIKSLRQRAGSGIPTKILSFEVERVRRTADLCTRVVCRDGERSIPADEEQLSLYCGEI